MQGDRTCTGLESCALASRRLLSWRSWVRASVPAAERAMPGCRAGSAAALAAQAPALRPAGLTAAAAQVLQDRGETGSRHGRAAFAILLLQVCRCCPLWAHVQGSPSACKAYAATAGGAALACTHALRAVSRAPGCVSSFHSRLPGPAVCRRTQVRSAAAPQQRPAGSAVQPARQPGHLH